MLDHLPHKPSHEEWLRWAQVVIDRLTTCVHVYSKPPYEDVFMAEAERQLKNVRTIDLLRRIHALTDEAETPTDSLAEVAYHDERVIDGLRVLLQETLERMPALSKDMQKLMNSPWYDNCNGRLANELFRGPMNYEPEGLGTGHPEHGRLPESLRDLLEREMTGESRQPRKALHRHQGGNAGGGPHHGPERHTTEVKRRWADRNTHLRSAGRVD